MYGGLRPPHPDCPQSGPGLRPGVCRPARLGRACYVLLSRVGGTQPWRCLWRGSVQMTMTRPWRRMTRHLLQIRLTLGLTFTVCLTARLSLVAVDDAPTSQVVRRKDRKSVV